MKVRHVARVSRPDTRQRAQTNAANSLPVRSLVQRCLTTALEIAPSCSMHSLQTNEPIRDRSFILDLAAEFEHSPTGDFDLRLAQIACRPLRSCRTRSANRTTLARLRLPVAIQTRLVRDRKSGRANRGWRPARPMIKRPSSTCRLRSSWRPGRTDRPARRP